MKPEIKVLWLAALRGGEYKQGRGQLRDGDNFCCLGVLCDLHANLTHKAIWEGEYYDGYSRSNLPPVVANWAGITTADPDLGEAQASVMNDGENGDASGASRIRPHSFAEIADLIDTYL